MVAAEEVPLQATAGRGAPASSRRAKLAAVTGLVCISLLVAPLLVSRQNAQGIVLEEKDDDTDKISDNLLGALEKAMDKSIDNKVEAYMSAPGVASIPIPKFPEEASSMEEHDHSTKHFEDSTYLEHLQAEKKELEEKREKLMNDLRVEHTAVATEATKQSIEANKLRLESALYRAKKRQLENAQDAARQAAKKMREALIAKQQAIHAEAVAQLRAHILDSMVHEAAAGGEEEHGAIASVATYKAASPTTLAAKPPVKPAAAAEPQTNAAAGSTADAGSSKQQGSGASKLARYETQEKVLLKKIAAAKQKAAAEAAVVKGKKPAAAQRAAMEGKVIATLAKAVKRNQGQIASDEAKAAALKRQEQRLLGSVQALKGKDTSLEVKEKVLAH